MSNDLQSAAQVIAGIANTAGSRRTWRREDLITAGGAIAIDAVREAAKVAQRSRPGPEQDAMLRTSVDLLRRQHRTAMKTLRLDR